MRRAFLLGVGLIVFIFGAYALAGTAVRESDAITWLASMAPGVAAFVAALRAPRKKVLLGVSMAPVAAAVAAVINAIDYWSGGRTDFPGMRGAVSVVEFVFVMSALPAVAGAVVGRAVASRFGRISPVGGAADGDGRNARP